MGRKKRPGNKEPQQQQEGAQQPQQQQQRQQQPQQQQQQLPGESLAARTARLLLEGEPQGQQAQQPVRATIPATQQHAQTQPPAGRGQGRGAGRGVVPPPRQQERQPGPSQGAWGEPRPAAPAQAQAAQGPRPQQPPGLTWGPRPQGAGILRPGLLGPRPQGPPVAGPGPRAQQPAQKAWGPKPPEGPAAEIPKQATPIQGAGKPEKPGPSSGPGKESVGPTTPTKAAGGPKPLQLPAPSPADYPGLKPPHRKGQGTVGRPIQLEANHFEVIFKKQIRTVYHYDVELVRNVPRKKKRAIILDLLNTNPMFRGYFPVFDGNKNVYTPKRIEGLEAQITINHNYKEVEYNEAGQPVNRDEQFQIRFQPTGTLEIDLEPLFAYCSGGSSVDVPQSAIQALDVALRHHPSSRLTPVRNSLFSQQREARDIGGGCEVWFGHYQSLRLSWKPFVNIDASQKAFVKSQKAHLWLADFYNIRVGDRPRDYIDFGKKVRGVTVKYPRRGYEAKQGVNGLGKPANEERFEHNGQQVTVEQYFRKEYRIQLKYPYYPCLWVGNRNRKNMVPMEICTVQEGQVVRGKLTDIQTSEMIKYAATPADERKRKILDSVRQLNYNADPFAQAFGLTISDTMVQIQGRVLPSPRLSYGSGEQKTAEPRNGTWDMRGLQFVVGKAMDSWGILTITRLYPDQLRNFVGALRQAGNGMGMNISDPIFTMDCAPRPDMIEKTMRNAQKQYPALKVVLVVIDRKGDPNYDVIKRIGDLELHLTTQCVQKRNVIGRPPRGGGGPPNPDPSTMANICLKLNAKLGGINNLIQRNFRPGVLLNEQVIIVGADVTHPTAEQVDEGRPSIAAVVGSVDPRAFQYCTEIRIQPSRQEFIEDMEGMMYNLLRKFNTIVGRTSTGKPQRIIFYRDGVSEGQFLQVLLHELSAIRRACVRIGGEGYKPPITLIIVQKRHHTRLFPKDHRDEVGKGKNVPPGTVVDKTIVHPTENDFYLVSHYGIQGTSRPTHYHLLWDDSNFSADDLQLMTYYLCYMYSRCTRSVSYPAPCYYAHLVADRGRKYYDALMAQNRRTSNQELQQAIDKTRDMNFLFFV